MFQKHLKKSLLLAGLVATASAAFATDSFAWDNCGVGRHRTSWGQCVSNFANGPGMRGCGPGYHWGRTTHACFPNR